MKNKILLYTAVWLLGCVLGLLSLLPGGATTAPNELANPAAVYCEDQGYEYQLLTAQDGNQSGVCVFSDGSQLMGGHTTGVIVSRCLFCRALKN